LPSSLREDEIADCNHGSQMSRKDRGALTATKSRFDGSFP